MKIVYFEWKDAYGNGGWFDRSEVNTLIGDRDLWTQTVGFLVYQTPRELVVCTTWQPENAAHRVCEKVANLHKIPRTWIRNFQVLGEVTGETRKNGSRKVRKS